MKPDALSGLIWLAIGVFAVVEGYALELGTANDPGSGALIFWAGILLTALSAGLLVNAVRGGEEGTVAALWRDLRWPKVVWVVAVLAAYGLALLPAGFLVSTTIFLFVLFLSVEWTRPPVAAAMAIGATVAVYFLFVRVLGVGLPRGILSF
ncbi:MAG: tripartite tricarboxylate transporter TctB family protein [Alphaproteobacteria bacterium]